MSEPPGDAAVLTPRRLSAIAIGLLAASFFLLAHLHATTGGRAEGKLIDPTPANLGVHPSVFLTEQEISAIRSRVAHRAEPWFSLHRQLIVVADAALALPPQTVVGKGQQPASGNQHDYWTTRPYAGTGDGVINPLNDRTDYKSAIRFSDAVRDLALAYRMTGEPRYARKAVALIETWMVDPSTRMTPRFTTTNSRIELAVTMPAAFYALDLLWDYPGWDDSAKQAAIDWVRRFGHASNAWRAEKANNFENWRVVVAASAGVVSGDGELAAGAFTEWQELLGRQMDRQGRLVEELDRTKSLSYSVYALKAMAISAEIAKRQGVDLYGYSDGRGRSLEKGFDFHAPYLVHPSSWPWQQIAPPDHGDASVYELAYAFKNKRIYLDVLEAYGRPIEENRILGPVTLTHGRLSPAGPS